MHLIDEPHARPDSTTIRTAFERNYSMLRISVPRVDGSLQDFDETADLMYRYVSLVERGFTGKRLVDELFTDDWGCPPRMVCITGTGPDGKDVDIVIPYS
jgi:hypothetical protein